MTDRERWTVYPLLLLATGLAMRAVLVPPAEVGELDAIRVVCREILVQDERGRVMLHLGRVSEAGGRIEINTAEGNALMAVGSLPEEHRPTDADADASGKDGPSKGQLPPEGPAAGIEFADTDGKVIGRITPADVR